MEVMRAVRLGVLAVILVAVVVLAFTGEAAAPPARLLFLQANICGNVCNDGGPAVVDALAASVRTREPAGVTLNELCENQYTRLVGELPAYRGSFDPTGPTCHNGTRYGNVILLRTNQISLVGSWLLPDVAGDESRRVQCLRGLPGMLVCGVHISSFPGNVAVQVRAVADRMDPLVRTDAVLLAGDFNADPANPGLDPLFRPCYLHGTGHFDEAAYPGCASRQVIPARVDTFEHHKFDYVYLSTGDWSDPRAEVADAVGGRSDHLALWVTVTLQPRVRAGPAIPPGTPQWTDVSRPTRRRYRAGGRRCRCW
jgi:endonuclease/exonuclease/phosphatase family metal-dependent hydrolase